jgi:hypothetical protein
MNNIRAWIKILGLCIGMFFSSCAGIQNPTDANFIDPVISLESFTVPNYDGYWFYSKDVMPTKGEAGDHGAPLPMSFLFKVRNPNPYPVELKEFRFTVVFDNEFDMVTVHVQDASWVPAYGTNQIRATTQITPHLVLLNLLVTGGYALKSKGWDHWEALERWWTKVPERGVPVTIKKGSFSFRAGAVGKVLSFEAKAS